MGAPGCRVYWHSLSIFLSFLGGESDSSVKIHNVDIFRSSCTLLSKMDQNGSKVKTGQNELKWIKLAYQMELNDKWKLTTKILI